MASEKQAKTAAILKSAAGVRAAIANYEIPKLTVLSIYHTLSKRLPRAYIYEKHRPKNKRQKTVPREKA